MATELEELNKTVDMADKSWMAYGWAQNAAYSAAYENQKRALGNVKTLEDARRKAEDAMISFALSILTVGVAGCLAGYLAKKIDDKAEDFIKGAKSAAGGVAKKGTDKAVKYLRPETLPGDPFAPAGVTPAEYISNTMANLTAQIRDLRQMYYDLRDKNLPPDRAKELKEQILGNSLILEKPADYLTPAFLQPKAELALWIGWALARDAEYWSAPGRRSPMSAEARDFKPVLDALLPLRVPAAQIAIDLPGGLMGIGAATVWVPAQPNGALNMYGFINWARSSQAVALLFDDTKRRNQAGYELARKQLQLKQAVARSMAA